jgi:SAM-dependent methyltransferase
VRKLDVTALPFPDRHFDVVICNHVFEVVPDDFQAMQETRRVMKNDGWGIFQNSLNLTLEHTLASSPTDGPEQRKALFGWDDIRRWYARDYAEVLGKAGFNVEVIDPFLHLKPGDAERHGLMTTDRIYQARRQSSLSANN